MKEGVSFDNAPKIVDCRHWTMIQMTPLNRRVSNLFFVTAGNFQEGAAIQITVCLINAPRSATSSRSRST